MKTINHILLFLILISVTLGSCKKDEPEEIKGCIDNRATNYNSEATKSDGSCVYPEEDNSGDENSTGSENEGSKSTEVPLRIDIDYSSPVIDKGCHEGIKVLVRYSSSSEYDIYLTPTYDASKEYQGSVTAPRITRAGTYRLRIIKADGSYSTDYYPEIEITQEQIESGTVIVKQIRLFASQCCI